MNGKYQDSNGTQRQVYYVDVQARQLYTQPDIASYHLVITANDYEVQQIEEQFNNINERYEGALDLMIKSTYRGGENIGYNNDAQDDDMRQLFQMLYNCGTDETRKHIESMNIL
ncbi:hypothetical protein ACFP56_03240 [Paenibacillus septentrionalis]|uniref:Hydrolase n=1 Tax=Paenibacillus septentrionalis TaxID=429342 RepID=A0ABW1V0Z9_9BACL